jgi:hypothetical protein
MLHNQARHVDFATIAEQIASRCHKAAWQKDHWQACCPAHDDSTPSLTITPTAERVLLFCHAKCSVNAIVDALGMTISDLRGGDHGTADSHAPANEYRKIVKVYDYFDASGTLVHQTVRYEPKDFRQRRPDPAKPGEYIWDLRGIEPVLYRLPAVLQAKASGKPIYLAQTQHLNHEPQTAWNSLSHHGL